MEGKSASITRAQPEGWKQDYPDLPDMFDVVMSILVCPLKFGMAKDRQYFDPKLG